MDATLPPTSAPCASLRTARLQRLIAATTALVDIAGELQVDTLHSWRTDAGARLLQQPDLTLQAQGCGLLLDDLLHEPGTCEVIVNGLRAALRASTTAPQRAAASGAEH